MTALLARLRRLLPKKKSRSPRPLEEALLRANRRPGRAPEFFRAFLSHELCTFRNVEAEGAWGAFTNPSGEEFVPLYSDPAYIPDLPGGYVVVQKRGYELLREILGSAEAKRLVLNPGRPSARIFSVADLLPILDRAGASTSPSP